MNSRDLNYIETRLLGPCVEASDACGRMRTAGVAPELRERLMGAMQTFIDECREIRVELCKLPR